jgi:hypothetical protein
LNAFRFVANNVIAFGISEAFFAITSGSITPTPEPSSLVAFGWRLAGVRPDTEIREEVAQPGPASLDRDSNCR